MLIDMSSVLDKIIVGLWWHCVDPKCLSMRDSGGGTGQQKKDRSISGCQIFKAVLREKVKSSS
jgi:hypothetical protein